MASKIKVDTIENVAGSGNVSLGSGHNLVVPGNITGQGTTTLTGNLTVDTNTLHVNTSNNRVGIGTTSPADHLSVVTSGANAQLSVDRSDGATGRTVLIHSSTGGQLQTTGSVPLIFGTADTERMRIDAGGRMTMPHQPRFMTEGTNYTQSAGNFTPIKPATVHINIGSHYNGTNGVFTAPVAGHYMFHFWGLSYPHSTESHTNSVSFYKNSGFYGDQVQFNGTASGHVMISGSTMMSMVANDTMALAYQSNASSSADAHSGQWHMTGYLLG